MSPVKCRLFQCLTWEEEERVNEVVCVCLAVVVVEVEKIKKVKLTATSASDKKSQEAKASGAVRSETGFTG